MNRAVAGAVFITALGCMSAHAEIKGEARSEDVTLRLQRQIAALEMRVKQLELGEAAINRKINKVDVPDAPDDVYGSDSKKKGDPGKTSSPPGKGDAGPGAGGTGAGPGADGGALQNMPGKPAGGSAPANGGHASSGMNRITAPFVVVDGAGKVIFRVQDPNARGGEGGGERGIYVFNEKGESAAQLVFSRGGGKLKVQKPASDTYVATAANDDGIGTMSRVNGKKSVFTGANPDTGGVVQVFGRDGEHAAAGLQLAEGGGGLVAVFKNDTPISFLTESTTHPGGGNITTTNPAGVGVFSAGYDGEQGAACVGHKGSLHCLGIGLPLGGGQ